ncbi:MAG: mechanosensitive ion channel family protein, partial [Gammaproteobacteria bacterium]|nr:mechanosensitive ion channel family protein [Gammaproteobacteria bacterium]
TLLWLTAGLIILSGVPMPAHLAIVISCGAAMVMLVVLCIWSSRTGVAALIRGGGSAAPEGIRLRAQLADIWHWLAIAYIAVVYLMWSLNMLARSPTAIWAAIGSVVLVFVLPLLDKASAHFIAGFLRLKSEVSGEATLVKSGRAEAEEGQGGEPVPDEEAAQAAAQRERFAAVAQTGARIVYGTLAAVILLQLWGVNIIGLAGPEAEIMFWTSLVEVAITLVVAVLIWRLTKSLIDPRIPDTPLVVGDEGHSAPRTRAQTLYPLLRTSILVVLIVFTFMIVLANLNVEIGPLLAGAGVVGLAIGFGAQTLVKDIVSGIFFLIDDAFRVGEYIEFGNLRGEVEAITLRSLKLRHHRGAVHTVPFGELRSITNYSRDWVIYKMEFRLPVGTDVEKVRKLIKKIGQELLEHPEHGDKFLQPLKSQGINRVEENALILRTKFMCKPREQFMIRRDALRRIAEVFAENGIQFAPRTVSVTGGNGVQADAASAAIVTEGAEAPPKQALE